MDDKEWLERANSFVLATQRDINPDVYEKYGYTDGDHIEVTLETRGKGRDGKGPMRWAVCHHGSCLSKKDLFFSRESLPSNRTEDYLSEHRFLSKEEAYACFLKWLEIEKTLNHARFLLGMWDKKSNREKTQSALMAIRYIDDWRDCLVSGSKYFHIGNDEKKIYPDKEFFKYWDEISDPNQKVVVEEVYNKIIKPIRKKEINDRGRKTSKSKKN